MPDAANYLLTRAARYALDALMAGGVPLEQAVPHAELLLQTYLPNVVQPENQIEDRENKHWKTEHLTSLTRLDLSGTPQLAKLAVRRRQLYTDAHAEVLKLRLVDEYATGLATPSLLNNGFALAKPWGIAQISGETIKGVVKVWLECCLTDLLDAEPAVRREALNDTGCHLLFPDQAHGSDVASTAEPPRVQWTIMDAWPAFDHPGCAFRVSGTTVHHADWYSGARDAVPDGTQNPTPAPHLAVRRGTPYDVAFIVEDAMWAPVFTQVQKDTLGRFDIKFQSGTPIKDFVDSLIRSAAEYHGFGTGTNLGSGRMAARAS